MILKREVTVDGVEGGLVTARGAVGWVSYERSLTDPSKVLPIFPSALGLNGSAARPVTPLVPVDIWETAGYAALWICALIAIGLCVI